MFVADVNTNIYTFWIEKTLIEQMFAKVCGLAHVSVTLRQKSQLFTVQLMYRNIYSSENY